MPGRMVRHEVPSTQPERGGDRTTSTVTGLASNYMGEERAKR